MRIGWRGALGLLLSAVLLVWAFWGLELGEVWRVLRASDPWLFALSAIVATMIFPLRARRWQTILEPVAGVLPFGPLWRATAIGALANNVFPARAGEIVRAWAVGRETGRVPFSAAFASLAVDRLFDAVVVLFLMVLAMLDPAFAGGTREHPVERWAVLAAVAIVLGLVALYGVARFPGALIRIYEALSRRIAPTLEERGRRMLQAFADGLGVLRSPRRFLAVLWWAVLLWLVNALAFWIGFEAVGIDVPMSAALVLQGIIAFGVAIPSSPGFVGVFEAFARIGLALYLVPDTAAISWAIGFHILSYVPITLIGAWYAGRLGLTRRDLSGEVAERTT